MKKQQSVRVDVISVNDYGILYKKKHIHSNTLLIREVRGEWQNMFELIRKLQQHQ